MSKWLTNSRKYVMKSCFVFVFILDTVSLALASGGLKSTMFIRLASIPAKAGSKGRATMLCFKIYFIKDFSWLVITSQLQLPISKSSLLKPHKTQRKTWIFLKNTLSIIRFLLAIHGNWRWPQRALIQLYPNALLTSFPTFLSVCKQHILINFIFYSFTLLFG